jgi:hypothetical protein
MSKPDLSAEIAKHMGSYTYGGKGVNHDRVVDLVTDDLRPFVRAAVDAAYSSFDDATRAAGGAR